MATEHDELIKRFNNFVSGLDIFQKDKLTLLVFLTEIGYEFKKIADAIEELQWSKCPHYIRNVHDRGDDSLCDKWACEVSSLPKDGES